MNEKVKLEHIGIIVRDLAKSRQPYENLLGLEVTDEEEVNVEGNQVLVNFLPVGEVKIELITSSATSGIVADFLREKGEGIHHLAFEVDDIETYYQTLKDKGVKFLWEDGIRTGSRNRKVFFFQPDECNGIYIEIIQKNKSDQ